MYNKKEGKKKKSTFADRQAESRGMTKYNGKKMNNPNQSMTIPTPSAGKKYKGPKIPKFMKLAHQGLHRHGSRPVKEGRAANYVPQQLPDRYKTKKPLIKTRNR